MTRRLSALSLAFLLLAVPARACNVPVFQYALENWAPDLFRVTVFHDGDLSAQDRAALALFDELGPANGEIELVNVAEGKAAPEGASLPWVVLRHPEASEIPGEIWSGPLSASAVRSLLRSPCRQELARRLADGHSVVWVLLKCGDEKQDEAAAKLAAEEIARLEKTLELPAPDEEDARKEPWKLRFSLLPVSRDDPAEAVFVRMLLTTEPDLRELPGPMVFPVFGRGRALYALVGAGINADTLTEAGEALARACSCTLKQAHPGKDLLLAADWSALAAGAEPQPVPPAGTVPLPPPPPQPAARADAAPEDPAPSAGPRYLLIAGVAGAALLVLITGRLAFRTRRET